MKLETKIFACGMLIIFLMFGSILLANSSTNKAIIQTSTSVEISNSKVEWGIKRGSNHEQPDLGNRNKELIEKYKGIAMGNNNDKNIYVTFDLGYEAGYTTKILDTLKENNVTATFFITAHYLNTASELVQRMIQEGHIVRKPHRKSQKYARNIK